MARLRALSLISHAPPLLLGLLAVLTYSMTLTAWHSGDDMQWIMAVRSAATNRPSMHPASIDSIIEKTTTSQANTPQIRYLLELPTSVMIYTASISAESEDRSLKMVQLAHAIFGAIGVAVFYLALASLISRILSIIVSIGLASSYAWWYYSTHLDYTIISHTWSCLILYLLVKITQSKSLPCTWVSVLGAVHVVSVLYLLSAIMVVPAILFALLLCRPKTERWIVVGSYASTSILTVGMAVIVTILTAGGQSQQASDVMHNLTYTGASAHDFALFDIPKTIYGVSKALVVYPFLGHESPNEMLFTASHLKRASFVLWYAFVCLIVMSPFPSAGLTYRKLGRYRNMVMVLMIWFGSQLPFGAYWEPSYIKWWTGSLIPWWALVGVLVAASSSSPGVARNMRAGLATLVSVVMLVNASSDFLLNTRSDRNPWLQVAHKVRGVSGPGDLFISFESNPMDFYLPYFADRKTLAYVLVYLSTGRDNGAVKADFGRAVRTMLDRGGRIFVYGRREPDTGQLRDLLGVPAIRLEPVDLDGLTISDFGLYQVVPTG